MYVEFANEYGYGGWNIGIWYSPDDKTLHFQLVFFRLTIGKK